MPKCQVEYPGYSAPKARWQLLIARIVGVGIPTPVPKGCKKAIQHHQHYAFFTGLGAFAPPAPEGLDFAAAGVFGLGAAFAFVVLVGLEFLIVLASLRR